MVQKVPVLNLAEIPLRDRDAPEVYGDMCANIHCLNGNVVLTIATYRLNIARIGSAERVVSGRLILPIGAAMDLNNQLSTVLQNIREQQQQQSMLQAIQRTSVN